MSYKTGLIKMAIKWTPKAMVLWVANMQLKGIAELTDFYFDLDARTLYVQATLVGEKDAIEARFDGFAIVEDGQSYRLIVERAQSNRIWLNNILARIVGKSWKIPAIPQLAAQMRLACELFASAPR